MLEWNVFNAAKVAGVTTDTLVAQAVFPGDLTPPK